MRKRERERAREKERENERKRERKKERRKEIKKEKKRERKKEKRIKVTETSEDCNCWDAISHLGASHSKSFEFLLVPLTQCKGTNFKALTIFHFPKIGRLIF